MQRGHWMLSAGLQLKISASFAPPVYTHWRVPSRRDSARPTQHVGDREDHGERCRQEQEEEF